VRNTGKAGGSGIQYGEIEFVIPPGVVTGVACGQPTKESHMFEALKALKYLKNLRAVLLGWLG